MCGLVLFGGTNRARTCDPMLVRHMLYQLSYDSILEVFYHSDGAKSNISFATTKHVFRRFGKDRCKKGQKTVEIFFDK